MAIPQSFRRYIVTDKEPDLQITRSNGSYVFDERGRRYIDFMTGWCVGNFGWGHPQLERVARSFRGPDYVYPGYAYETWGELARLLVSVAPGQLARCARATGGSEAVDIALQAAMIHTGRNAFLSLEDSYHGNTIGALSVAESSYREHMPALLPRCTKIQTPLDERALERIRRRLARRDVAAFIFEPISINLGVTEPAPDIALEIQRLCRRFGTMLIADEVASGFGRTGRLFACEHFNLEPDIMTVAKALTGGVSGIGAVLMTEDVAESVAEHGNVYSTYGWHPRSTAVAIATMKYLIKRRGPLMRGVERMSKYFHDRFLEMPFDEPPELRIRGMALAVDIDDEERATEIQERCRRNGLLFDTNEGALLLLPALNVPRDVAEEGLDILADAVAR
jgi:acetylornithine/succinyldiaminopimelate/putrescine aminotransferase